MFPPETLFLTLTMLTLNIVCGFNEKQRNESKLNIETQKLRFHILNTEAQIHRFSEIMIQNISKMSVSAILLPYNWPCYSSAARSGRTKSQMWWFPSNHILLGLWFASCSLNPPRRSCCDRSRTHSGASGGAAGSWVAALTWTGDLEYWYYYDPNNHWMVVKL